MPVLPLVASRITLPRCNLPERSPSRIIEYAARSFTEPPGLNHSALAQISTLGNSAPSRDRRINGVLPMRSSQCWPTGAATPTFSVDTSGLLVVVNRVFLPLGTSLCLLVLR